MDDLKRNKVRILIRDAWPDDAPFLAKCIMAGMHFYDFESGIPEEDDLFRRLTACERRDDIRLYESIGFVPADRRHAFGVDFQRMVICHSPSRPRIQTCSISPT